MKKLNILSIGGFDAAGVNTQFAKTWNKLNYGEWNTYFQENYLDLPEKLKDGLTTMKELQDVINKTDVFIVNPFLSGGENILHLMNDWDIISCQGMYVFNHILKTGKPIIMYVNGSNNARKFCLFYRQQFEYFKFNIACSTPDLVDFFPKAKYLPMFIDYNEKFWQLDKYKSKIHIIGHFPTNPSIKNTREFIGLSNKLEKENFPVHFVASQGLPHMQCINHKRDMTFTFDHLQGYYGVNSLESAVLGVINFVRIDKNFLERFYAVAGVKTTPWILVNTIDDVEVALRDFMNNPDKINKEQQRTKQWMIDNWSPEKHIKRIYDYMLSLSSNND